MPTADELHRSLPIDEFWSWLGAHYNCILRAGGPGYAIFDQPDVHWRLGEDPDGILFAQLVRGKETTAELFFNPADVLYVQPIPEEEDQMLFELIGGPEGQTGAIGHFLMTHSYDENDGPQKRAWTH